MKKKDLGTSAVPNGHGAKFRRKDFEAIDALISEPTIEAAAEKVGLDEKTLRRWLQNPDFRKRYEQERMHRINVRFRGLDEAVPSAIRGLLDVVRGYNTTDRDEIATAKALLDAGLKELQLHQVERRLNTLEQKMAAPDDGESFADTAWNPDPVTDESLAEAPHLVPVRGTLGPAPSIPNEPGPASPSPVTTEGGGAAQRPLEIMRRRRMKP